MKFIRIFPETWAMIMCPFSNSTLNTALGKASLTTAEIRIASSFDIDYTNLGHFRVAGADRGYRFFPRAQELDAPPATKPS